MSRIDLFVLALIVAETASGALAQGTAPAPAPAPAPTQTAPPRPTPPTRDPKMPGYVAAKELPDGAVPPPDVDGNFIIGPSHSPAPEMTVQEGVPQGTIINFTMSS